MPRLSCSGRLPTRHGRPPREHRSKQRRLGIVTTCKPSRRRRHGPRATLTSRSLLTRLPVRPRRLKRCTRVGRCDARVIRRGAVSQKAAPDMSPAARHSSLMRRNTPQRFFFNRKQKTRNNNEQKMHSHILMVDAAGAAMWAMTPKPESHAEWGSPRSDASSRRGPLKRRGDVGRMSCGARLENHSKLQGSSMPLAHRSFEV